jgi:HEAT repeat protein
VSAAASALGELQADEALRPMAELTAHRRQRVRRAAAAALGGIPSSESPRILTQLLRDALDADDALVALEAARSLGRLRQTRVENPC